ncbi:MAG TPA: GNAT family N-acetyltransferase [Ktedonobacterales bacterium]|jgi:ribosomal protein S18 acetylase RimI-like enzyme
METELLPGVTMRPATPADDIIFMEMHEELANWLWERGIRQWQPGTFPVRWIQDAIARGDVYLASEDSRVIGAVIVQASDTFTWGKASVADVAGYIHGLRVRRSAAGRGIGLAMLHWAEREIAARGLHLARLDCMGDNLGLCAYYERAGYRRVQTKAHQGGDRIYLIAMFEKSLDGE